MKTTNHIKVLLLLFIATVLSTLQCKATTTESILLSKVNELIEENIRLNIDKEVTMNGIYLDMAPLIYKFYEVSGYNAVWTQSAHHETTNKMIDLVKNCVDYGIDPDYFAINQIEHLQKEMSRQKKTGKKAIRQAQFEFLMTNMVFQYYMIIQNGMEYYLQVDFEDLQNEFIQQMPAYLYDALLNNELLKFVFYSTEGDEPVYFNYTDLCH